MELLIEFRERERGIFRFIRHGESIIEGLVVLDGIDELASRLVGARTNEKKSWLGRGRGVSSESLEGILRAPDINGGGSVGFEDLLFNDCVWIVLQESGEFLSGFAILAQSTIGLCSPEERVLAEEWIGLGFLEPVERLWEARLGIIVVAESEGGTLSPNAGGILIGEGSELVVVAGVP